MPDHPRPVTTMQAAWNTPARWSFEARNTVSGVLWHIPEEGEKYRPSGLEDGYQILSLHKTTIDCADVRLEGRSCFSGALTPGSWMIVPSGGHPEAVTRGQFEVLHLYLPNALLLDASADYDANLTLNDLEQYRQGEFDQSALARTCVEICEAATTDHPLQQMQLDTLSQVLVSDMVQLIHGQAAPKLASLSRAQTNQLEAFLRAHLFDDLTLADLTAISGLSPAHFSRAFKAAFGRSPMREVQNRRLEQAAQLLSQSKVPIAEIALTCRFSDQSHLTRCFRKRFGQTPAAYRKAHQLQFKGTA